jgi:diguanylate cyclase (GGDEF)-like protein
VETSGNGTGDPDAASAPALLPVHPPRSGRSIARADQAVVIADAMGPFCGVGAIMFALVAAAQFAFDKTPGSWGSSVVAAVTAVVLAIGFLLLHGGRGAWIRAHSLPFGVGVAALVGLNPVIYIIGTEITYPAIGMLLVIVGVGALLHDWVWATIVILALDVTWILCALAFGIPVPPAIFLSQILKANALAIVLNVARTRTVRRFEQARLEVHRLATTDELTGLANQRGLLEVARQLSATDGSGARDLALVYVDVDGLKSVNDQHGHAAGDALIRTVADVLRRAFRPHDTIARVGGDEFAILLAGPNPESMVARVHEHLAAVGVSASIGTAVSTPGSSDVDLADLLERADAAMYAVKLARKNGSAP